MVIDRYTCEVRKRPMYGAQRYGSAWTGALEGHKNCLLVAAAEAEGAIVRDADAAAAKARAERGVVVDWQARAVAAEATLATVERIGWLAICSRNMWKADAIAAHGALDEAERATAVRLGLLEAVVAALPKCEAYGSHSNGWRHCGKPATRSGNCDPRDSYCCDKHKCRHECPELPYAAALRALDDTAGAGGEVSSG